jgi:peptidoglycan/xylan/chitin deacetylase (PgdA/CDA1 family)
MGTLTRVSTRDPIIALTFDDGPHPATTPRLLDILDKHHAHASFFMLGEPAQRYPEIVREVAQAGHAIGNHSWDHPSFPLITRQERLSQIRQCARALGPYGQRLFRPPYGHQSKASRFDALWLRYQVVTWDLVAYDWLDHDADWITDLILNQIRPGSIILLHDALYHTIQARYADRQPTLDAVSGLLEQLGNRYRFVTIPELLRHGQPQLSFWYRAGDPDWLNQLSPTTQPQQYPKGSIT